MVSLSLPSFQRMIACDSAIGPPVTACMSCRLEGLPITRRGPSAITSTQWVCCIACRYVLPRPEGRRCLVISSKGGTTSWQRNGTVLHRFPSALPNGSQYTQAAAEIFCILDCVFHEPDATYYVMDLMCWKVSTVKVAEACKSHAGSKPCIAAISVEGAASRCVGGCVHSVASVA